MARRDLMVLMDLLEKRGLRDHKEIRAHLDLLETMVLLVPLGHQVCLPLTPKQYLSH